MKTIEELAVEYCSEQPAFVPREQQAFIAGAKASQEWISIDNELPEDHKVVILRLGGEMTEDQSFGIIPVTAYREKGKWYYALFGEEIEEWYTFEDWKPIERR